MKIRCKACYAELNYQLGDSFCICGECGFEQSLPLIAEETDIQNYNFAVSRNQFLQHGVSKQILLDELWHKYKSRHDADLYWSILLNKYGVSFHTDGMPVMSRLSDEPFTESAEYKATLKYCTDDQRKVFQKQAAEILKIQMLCQHYQEYYRDEIIDIVVDWTGEDMFFDKAKEVSLALRQRGYKVKTRGYILNNRPQIDVMEFQHAMIQDYICAHMAKCYILIMPKESFCDMRYYENYIESHSDLSDEKRNMIEIHEGDVSIPNFNVSFSMADENWLEKVLNSVEKMIGRTNSFSGDSSNKGAVAWNELLLNEIRKIGELNVTRIPNRKVFISYSSKELNVADDVRNTLKANDIFCWMAPESIPAGSDYGNEIGKAIRECDALVVILSENAQNSKWVSKELDFALSHDKLVVPFLIDEAELNPAFDFRLTDVQRINSVGRKEEALKELVERLTA